MPFDFWCFVSYYMCLPFVCVFVFPLHCYNFFFACKSADFCFRQSIGDKSNLLLLFLRPLKTLYPIPIFYRHINKCVCVYVYMWHGCECVACSCMYFFETPLRRPFVLTAAAWEFIYYRRFFFILKHFRALINLTKS